MTMSDPRLADLALLTLAAMRARQRPQVPDWRNTVGLCALLDAAKALPKRDPWDLPDLDTTSGLGKMLAEARARRKERADGT